MAHFTVSRFGLPALPSYFRKYTDPLRQRVERVSIPVIKWALTHEWVTLPACTVLPSLPPMMLTVYSLARGLHGYPFETALTLTIAGSVSILAVGTHRAYRLFTQKVGPFLVQTCLHQVMTADHDYKWAAESISKGHLIYWYDFNERDKEGENIFHKMARQPLSSTDMPACLRALHVLRIDIDAVNHKGERPLDLAARISTAENSVFSYLLFFGAFLRKCPSLLQQIPIVSLISCCKNATIFIDKESLFYPIFEELKRVQKQIPGGESDNRHWLEQKDKGSYREDLQNGALIHRHPDMTPFRHTLTTLLALQELHAPEYQALIREHNNSRPLGQNLAADLIFNLTGIVIHLERNSPAIIENFCTMVLTAFNKAQNEGHTLDFFRKGFQPGNVCLEGRMVHFQEYVAPDDFEENFFPHHTLSTKLGEHFRVFRNKRFQKIVGDRYKELAVRMRQGDLPKDLAKRVNKWCSKRNFLKYLKNYYKNQKSEPISTLEEDRFGLFTKV